MMRFLTGGLVGAFLLLSALANAKTPNVIVLDVWWSVKYAKGICDRFARNELSQSHTIAAACKLGDPADQAKDFLAVLQSEFAASPLCAGLVLHEFRSAGTDPSPDMAKTMAEPHWSLTVDYLPGRGRHRWVLHLRRLDTRTESIEGAGTAQETAANVCTAVKGGGAP